MAQELLDPRMHAQLRYAPLPASEPHFVPLVTSEFLAAAAACPIVLTKDARNGAFYPGALLGLTPERGALQGLAARGGFLPLHLQREGFLLDGQRIVIDRACPRFSLDRGEPLFDGGGQPTACLRRIQQVLGRLAAGLDDTRQWLTQLLELQLIEPIDIRFDLDDGAPLQLQGLYCVSRDALQALADEQALSLFRSGALALIHAADVSLGRLPVLGGLARRMPAS